MSYPPVIVFYNVSYQRGLGFQQTYFLKKTNAEKYFEKLKAYFTKLQAETTTAVNYDILDTLKITEVYMADAEIEKEAN